MKKSQGLTRRDFLKRTVAHATLASVSLLAAGSAAKVSLAAVAQSAAPDPMKPVREFLALATLDRSIIDQYIEPAARVFARFDPDLGYVVRSCLMTDGLNGSNWLATIEPTGERRMVNFAGRPCRINTYGDGFTQCCQVNDGETWQEVLAARMGEPVRNLGVGGYGAYQCYRRMLKAETSDQGASHIILNLWRDDNYRSFTRLRYLDYVDGYPPDTRMPMFHGAPWPYVRLDPSSGELIEHDNPMQDPRELYKLCDREYVYETYKDDPCVRLLVIMRSRERVPPGPVADMGEALGMTGLDFSTREKSLASALEVMNAYNLAVSKKVIVKINDFARANGKKLMVALCYPDDSVREFCRTGSREPSKFFDWFPGEYRDFVAGQGIAVADSLPKFLEEFRAAPLTPEEFVKRLYVGHFSPAGNQFYARALEDEVVHWLEPKPPSYASPEEALEAFKRNLPG